MSSAMPLYRKLKILKLGDLISLETSKSMIILENCTLPIFFSFLFSKKFSVLMIDQFVFRKTIYHCAYAEVDRDR